MPSSERCEARILKRRPRPTRVAAGDGQDDRADPRKFRLPRSPRETPMFGLTNDDAATNAIDLLKRDHRSVEELFKHYEDIKDGAEDAAKEELVAQICDALT